MIEPTETETPETLDAFVEAMLAIAQEAKENPDLVKNAPHSTPVKRLDEARAARKPILRWDPGQGEGIIRLSLLRSIASDGTAATLRHQTVI